MLCVYFSAITQLKIDVISIIPTVWGWWYLASLLFPHLLKHKSGHGYLGAKNCLQYFCLGRYGKIAGEVRLPHIAAVETDRKIIFLTEWKYRFWCSEKKKSLVFPTSVSKFLKNLLHNHLFVNSKTPFVIWCNSDILMWSLFNCH